MNKTRKMKQKEKQIDFENRLIMAYRKNNPIALIEKDFDVKFTKLQKFILKRAFKKAKR